MAYFSDLLPLLMQQQQFQPPGGPVMRPLPKAQTNVTGASIPGVKLPPDYATTMGNLANLFSEMPLRSAQAQQANLNSQFLNAQIKAMPGWQKLIDNMGAGQPIPINGNAQQGANAGNAPQQAGGGEVGSPAPNADTGSAPVGDGGIGAGPLYSHLTDSGATPNEAALLTSAANNESGFKPDQTHDGGIGYGLWGHNSDRLSAMRQFAGVGANDPVPWQKQADFALQELRSRPEGASVNDAKTPQQLTDLQMDFERPNRNINNGNYDSRLAATREYMSNPPGAKPTQVAQADTGTASDATPVSQSAWSALGGEGAPPAAPASAPNATGLPPAAPPAAAPTATPFTNAPPITGVGAPAPGPQARPVQVAQAPQAAPQAMPSAPMPLMPTAGGGAAFGTGLDPVQLAKLGAMSELYHLPNVAAPLTQAYYNSPEYKQKIAQAEKQVALQYAGPMAMAGKQVELQMNPQIAARTEQAKLPFTPQHFRQGEAGGFYNGPPDANGNPTFVLGFQNPRLAEGQQLEGLPGGGYGATTVPNALQGIQAASTANAAGPATYHEVQAEGPYGRGYTTTALNLANSILTGRGAPGAPPQVVPGTNMATPLSIPPQTPAPAGQPPAAILPGAATQPATPQQRAEAAAPTFPVQTPSGAKDISGLSVNDMFPNGQGIPQPPAPPPGTTYGKPSETEIETQKDDAGRLKGYGQEAAENQKIYVDLGHLRDIMQRGVTTSTLAPAMAELGNVAQGMGLSGLVPQKYDPSDLAVFNKATTDLTFAAVKKMAGAAKVAEIDGYAKANPNMTMPVPANISVVNDVLSQGKWQDARARLANEYVTQTGGAPLAAFDAKFNQMAPLVDVAQSYKDALRATPQYQAGLKNGIGLSEDLNKPAQTTAPGQPRRLMWNPQTKMLEPH